MITRPDPSARNDLRLCCVAVVISYHPPKWCNLRFLRNNPIFVVAGILAAWFFVEYLLRMLCYLFLWCRRLIFLMVCFRTFSHYPIHQPTKLHDRNLNNSLQLVIEMYFSFFEFLTWPMWLKKRSLHATTARSNVPIKSYTVSLQTYLLLFVFHLLLLIHSSRDDEQQ